MAENWSFISVFTASTKSGIRMAEVDWLHCFEQVCCLQWGGERCYLFAHVEFHRGIVLQPVSFQERFSKIFLLPVVVHFNEQHVPLFVIDRCFVVQVLHGVCLMGCQQNIRRIRPFLARSTNGLGFVHTKIPLMGLGDLAYVDDSSSYPCYLKDPHS